MPDPDALFEPVGEAWMPTDFARGPWSRDALHGGPVGALLARAAEATAAASTTEFHPARFTVELVRPVPVAPLTATATVIRPGRKVQLTDAELTTADGTLVASGRLLQIRSKDVEAPVTTDITGPTGPGGLPAMGIDPGADIAFHTHGVEHRLADGMFGEPGPATDWIRMAVPVVAEEEPSPLQRVAAAADFGNGVSGLTTAFDTLLFINADLSVHLHRLPAGEWVCLDAVTWMENTGVAVAESRLWDERGPLGRSVQSLLVDERS